MNKRRIFLLLFFVISLSAYSQSSSYPEIASLKSSDPIFKEYSYIVADNYKLLAAGNEPDMIIFSHKVTDENLTLLALAARCNIPYDTIATINQLQNSTEKIYGKTILLPSAPGLFITTEKPQNSLEILLQENYFNNTLTKKVLYYTISGRSYSFIADQRFSPTERAYFLDSELRLPLSKDSYWISSAFGKRKNPFSGEWKEHKGIDLAAAEGTPVYAIKDGNIEYCIKNDSVFGNYVIISHDNGSMTSVYAHLSKIAVNKYDSIKKGEIIGYVGSTGMATGSHLHFEIRKGGVPLDPQKKLNLQQ